MIFLKTIEKNICVKILAHVLLKAETTIKLVIVGVLCKNNELEISGNYLVFEKMPEMI